MVLIATTIAYILTMLFLSPAWINGVSAFNLLRGPVEYIFGVLFLIWPFLTIFCVTFQWLNFRKGSYKASLVYSLVPLLVFVLLVVYLGYVGFV